MTQPRTAAVLFVGNSGAGKSTLLSQLSDHNFGAGARLNEGYASEIEEYQTRIDGQPVVLMDVPGRTKHNATKLTDALRRHYDLKLYFVLQAHNRGPSPQELVMMHEVNQCVRQFGSTATFRIIVNQILDEEVKMMYQPLADDNFTNYFSQLKMPDYSFNIRIEKVLMLDFDAKGVKTRQLKELLEQDIQQYKALTVTLERDPTFRREQVYEVGGFLAILFNAIKAGSPVEYQVIDQ
ncbi:hypothetical protein EC991_003513 [Linnemannia zychae]|nr:hypothetical protein EC991_003513 [Linnemannia zychae]